MTDFSDRGFRREFMLRERAYNTTPLCDLCGEPMTDVGQRLFYGDDKVWKEEWVCLRCEMEDSHGE